MKDKYLTRSQQSNLEKYRATRNAVPDEEANPRLKNEDMPFSWEDGYFRLEDEHDLEYDPVIDELPRLFKYRLDKIIDNLRSILKRKKDDIPLFSYNDAGERESPANVGDFVSLYPLYSTELFSNGLMDVVVNAIGDLDSLEVVINHNTVVRDIAQNDQKSNVAYMCLNDYELKLYLLLSPFWIRSPLSWKPEVGYKPEYTPRNSLKEHLFGRYPAPRAFQGCFLPEDRFIGFEYGNFATSIKWLFWYLLFVQGVSFRHVARQLNWPLTKKQIQYLIEDDPDYYDYDCYGPLDAIVSARVKALGGNHIDYHRLTDEYRFDISEMSDDQPNRFQDSGKKRLDDWDETVSWLIRHRGELDDDEAGRILHWVAHCRIEEVNQEITDGVPQQHDDWFSLTGRSCANVLHEANAYYDQIHQPVVDRELSWKSHRIDWCIVGRHGLRCQFVELLDSKSLLEEGQRMSHCVGSYDSQCHTGKAAIVSMRINGHFSLTIELDMLHRCLGQIRGKHNRIATFEELQLVHTWFEMIIAKR